MYTSLTIPFGNNKGAPIASCPIADLNWAIVRVAKRLKDDPNHRFADTDRRWLAEAQAVFAERSEGVVIDGPSPEARAAATSPLAVVPSAKPNELLAKLTLGALRDAEVAMKTLAQAASIGHLISPQTGVGTLPEGCSLQVSGVVVDVARETYTQTGSSERGLHKVAIDKIAAAAGIDWDPVLSRRLDDRRHPWYCACVAVGRVRQFDGTWRTLSAQKEIDLREGGQDTLDILGRDTEEVKKQRELAGKRKHILSLCDTEARLRATRGLVGLRVSYTPAELEKPFIVVRLVFDGRSENAETRAYFNGRIADSFLGASQQLYSETPAAPPQLRQAEPRVIELPADEQDDDGPPDYGFGPSKRTGTGGPY
jgi:hypothetical protein